jgi:hypothetical protein
MPVCVQTATVKKGLVEESGNLSLVQADAYQN